jgi:hypothetical protein
MISIKDREPVPLARPDAAAKRVTIVFSGSKPASDTRAVAAALSTMTSLLSSACQMQPFTRPNKQHGPFLNRFAFFSQNEHASQRLSFAAGHTTFHHCPLPALPPMMPAVPPMGRPAIDGCFVI